jgi:hypothetical protein
MYLENIKQQLTTKQDEAQNNTRFDGILELTKHSAGCGTAEKSNQLLACYHILSVEEKKCFDLLQSQH